MEIWISIFVWEDVRLCQENAVFFWVQNDYFWAYFGLKFSTGDPRECPQLIWEPSGVPWAPIWFHGARQVLGIDLSGTENFPLT